MESLPKDVILEFNPDTLQFLRKQYNLDKPGKIEEAINLLEEWIKKQPHFRKTDFPKDYLERTIIISKGSVERAKFKLDRICMFRTLYPNFFGVRDMRKYKSLSYLRGAFLPKLTKEHYRIYLAKTEAKTYPSGLMEMYRYFMMQCEYVQAHDYCNGLVLLIDFNEADIMETLKAHNLSELRQLFLILKEGYGMRLKGLHLLSESKTIDVIVGLLKQALSAKITERIVLHHTVDTFYEYVPKEILPKEYGGNEKSLIDLHNLYLDVLSSKEFSEYLTEINKATTNEELRVVTDSGQGLGVPGIFRALSVD